MTESTTMHDAIKQFILDRKLKKEENLLTTKLEKDKDGGLNKILIKQLKASDRYSDEDLKSISDRKKTREQSPLVFHKEKLNDLVTLAKSCNVDISEFELKYAEQKETIKSEHHFATWLDNNCKNAEGASVATHVSKLTHSSNKASCFFDQIQSINSAYVTTSTIQNQIVDGAYDNALYSPIVSLLLVEHNGSYFYEEIMRDNFEGLAGFAENEEQLEAWKTQLKKSIDKPEKASHSLSKQIYFPVKEHPTEVEDWHLLSVLVSSSLAHEIFNKTGSKEFNDKSRSLREKFLSKSLYNTEKSINYPRKATLMVTQSSHQNTSLLNGKRSGRLFLLSSQPPTWQSQLKAPINKKSWFYGGVPSSSVKEDIEYLRDFLIRFERLELSTRAPKKKDWLIKWGNRILSKVMFHAENIQNLPSGWSDHPDIKLKKAHQYFLDPYRKNDAFQSDTKLSDWQDTVATDFAKWLNWKIQGREKKFTPQGEHTKLWKSLMLDELREHELMVRAILSENKEREK